MTAKKTTDNPITAEELAQARSADGWNPTAGDKIRGTLVLVEERQGDWDPYPMLVLDTEDGFVAVHAFHQTLQNQLRAIKPKPGSQLVITYQGTKERKRPEKDGSHRTYHRYTVVDPNAVVEEYDWEEDADVVPDEAPF